MPMKNPPHPGDFIRTEIVEPAGLSAQPQPPQRLQVSRPPLSSLLNGKADLSGRWRYASRRLSARRWILRLCGCNRLSTLPGTRRRKKEIRVRRFNPRVTPRSHL